MYKIHFETFGCSANLAESEMMMGLLDKSGFKLAAKIEDSEIIVLNICTVKGEFSALREIRSVVDKYKDKKLIIAGCLTPQLIRMIHEVYDEASLVSTHNISKIVEVAEELMNGNILQAVTYDDSKKINMPRMRRNPIVGVIPISSGCNNACAYCSVRLVKGKLVSYPQEDILAEVKHALDDGCKEIWITSQDNAAYGTENIWRSALPELLRKILAIDKEFKIRIGMMNPKFIAPIQDELIEIYKNDKVFKFLHIPIQSGNNEILKKMRRNYAAEEFKEIISKFRAEIPALTVSTDVILAFPGETDEQFSDTLSVIREVQPEVLNISRFIEREGTESFSMTDKVDGAVSKSRSSIVTSVFGSIALIKNEKWYGWSGEILIDERGKDDSWIGRNFAYKQVIIKGNYKLGDIVNVRIKNFTSFDLKADVIK